MLQNHSCLYLFRTQGGIKIDIFGIHFLGSRGAQGAPEGTPRAPKDAPGGLLERIGLGIEDFTKKGVDFVHPQGPIWDPFWPPFWGPFPPLRAPIFDRFLRVRSGPLLIAFWVSGLTFGMPGCTLLVSEWVVY